MRKYLDPYYLFPALFLSIVLAMAGLLLLCAINHAFGTQTVLETFPGTKTVCSRQQYNYSTKTTVCVEHKSVPAVCKKTEYSGPIFDTYINTQCE